MSTYPDFEILIQNPNKNRLMEVRKSPIAMMSLIAVFLVSVVAVYFLTILLSSSIAASLPLVSYISPRIFVLVPLVLLLEIVRRIHNDLYIFSQHRLTHLRGRFSLSYNVPVIKYEDIRAINVAQDFWGRIFDYGDIAVGTAAHEGNEIVISGVRSPEKLALLLDKLRSHSLKVESKEIRQAVVAESKS